MTNEAKLDRLNKMIGLCLQGCKRYKGQGIIHTWIKDALHFLMKARAYLKQGLYTVYAVAMDMAKRRITWANHEVRLSVAFA